jgi:hypothetical protein
MTVRKRMLPAGWYPVSAADCEAEIKSFLTGFSPLSGDFIGGVAPHAGWAFSGRAAAKTIFTLSKAGPVDRIVLYGGHLPGRYKPLAYPEREWETPLGNQPLDHESARELAEMGVLDFAGPRFSDNTVEVQMPFLAYFFPDAPILAAHSPSSQTALSLGKDIAKYFKSKGLSVIYIGSADLTHYGPNYGFAPKGVGPEALAWVKEDNDRRLIDNALKMNAQDLIQDSSERQNTCSAGPIASVISSCSEIGANEGRLIEYYTSYDVMPGDSFVGYAAIVY